MPTKSYSADCLSNGIRVGSGAYTMTLLDDVPVWYELWRKINGFPPNYYQPQSNVNDKK